MSGCGIGGGLLSTGPFRPGLRGETGQRRASYAGRIGSVQELGYAGKAAAAMVLR